MERSDKRKLVVLYAASVFFLLFSAYTFATLPEANTCRVLYDTGEEIIFPRDVCMAIHTKTASGGLMTAYEWNLYVNGSKKVDNISTDIIFNENRWCDTIEFPDCPELKLTESMCVTGGFCPVKVCEICPFCNEPDCPDVEPNICEISDAKKHELLSVKVDGNEHPFFQAGFSNCKKKIKKMLG